MKARTQEDIRRSAAARFRRWTEFLYRENGEPILMLALAYEPDGSDCRAVVTTCEEVSDEEIEDMLKSTLEALKKGRVTHR